MHQFTKSLTRVLAIQNFGSSGSKFVHALLDNHPNILAIPSLYMISFYGFWPTDIKRKRDDVTNEFIQTHEYWFDPNGYAPWGTNKMGPNRDETVYVERDIFVKNLAEVLDYKEKVTRKLFFQALYVAYAMSYDRSLNLDADQYVMLYPYHTARATVATELTRDFPDTRFIHCFREPIQTLGSTYKIGSTRWSGFAVVSPAKRYTTAEVELNIFLRDTYIANIDPYTIHGISPIIPEYKSRSRALQLEELVKCPKDILTKLCNWIDVPWDDALLEATYNGKLWWNRPESAQVTGFSNKPLSRKHADVFCRFDLYRLNVLLAKTKSKMGYSSVLWQPSAIERILFFMSLLLPLKMELLSVFPSKFSLHATFQFINRVPENMQAIARNRSLRRVGLWQAKRELLHYSTNWLLLTPVRSYVNVRRIFFQAMSQLSEQKPVIVEHL